MEKSIMLQVGSQPEVDVSTMLVKTMITLVQSIREAGIEYQLIFNNNGRIIAEARDF